MGVKDTSSFDFNSAEKMASEQQPLKFEIAPHQSFTWGASLEAGISDGSVDKIKNVPGLMIMGSVDFKDEIGGSYRKRFCTFYALDNMLAVVKQSLCNGWNETIDTTPLTKLKT